jgi:hypothetical protein
MSIVTRLAKGAPLTFAEMDGNFTTIAGLINAGFNYAVDTGSLNALQITLASPPTLYIDGMNFSTKVANTTTSTSTLQVNALGAKNIYDEYGVLLPAGLLVAGQIYTFVYNSSLNSGAGGFNTYLSNTTTQPYLPPGTGAISTTVASDLNNQFWNVQRFGAATSVTDNGPAINTAISSLSAVGGGTLVFSAGNYNHSTQLVQANNVRLMGYGATLTWTGGATSQLTSPTTGVLINAGIEGITLNCGATATKCIEWYSAFHCTISNVTVVSNSLTNIIHDLLTNTSGAVNAAGNRNVAYNYIENLYVQGSCGTGLRLTGLFSGSAIPATLNMWVNFEVQNAAVMGINFVQWCDSNFFAGITRIGLNIANNGVGVTFNSGSPTSNVGVYSNNFDHLAVDTFAGFSGRVGIQMNFTKLNNIRYFFNDPAAEGGPFLTTANTQSYNVLHQTAGTGNLIMRNQLTTFNGVDQPVFTVGGGGDISTGPVGISVGPTRTGSGISYLDLIGDTTYTAYGTQLIRQAGPNGNTGLNHRGTGGIEILSQDAGGYVAIRDSIGYKFIVNNTGIGFFAAATAPQSTGWGTPIGGAVIPSYNITDAGGASSNTNKAVAQIIAVMKAYGLFGA